MVQATKRRTTREKVAIFRTCFSGLTHVYGTYDPVSKRVRQVKQTVTDKVLLRHLKGEQPYGVYLLDGSRTRAVAADFDEDDLWLPLQLIRRAEHYGLRLYLERSKSKGWHVWLFTVLPGVSAAKARAVVHAILSDVGGVDVELFPKQDELTSGCCYGNFISTPLFGALVPHGRTVFVDPDCDFSPWPDQWELLERVCRVSEEELDELIEINEWCRAASRQAQPSGSPGAPGENDVFGLVPCARHMLARGVTGYQRVACFRLAVQLKKAGLPQDITRAALKAWALKNTPAGDKPVISDAEIAEQTGWAYARDYRSCGCDDPAVQPFCQENCPLRHREATEASPERDKPVNAARERVDRRGGPTDEHA